MRRPLVFGPTYAEMRDPQLLDPGLRTRARAARDAAPLAEENLFNLGWHDYTGPVAFPTGCCHRRCCSRR